VPPRLTGRQHAPVRRSCRTVRPPVGVKRSHLDQPATRRPPLSDGRSVAPSNAVRRLGQSDSLCGCPRPRLNSAISGSAPGSRRVRSVPRSGSPAGRRSRCDASHHRSALSRDEVASPTPRGAFTGQRHIILLVLEAEIIIPLHCNVNRGLRRNGFAIFAEMPVAWVI
jgi:hypothetical protein